MGRSAPRRLPEQGLSMRAKRLTTQQKQEIFSALVSAQDSGSMTVAQSHDHIMKQFGITDEQLRSLVDEGLEAQWPPLSEEVQEVVAQ